MDPDATRDALCDWVSVVQDPTNAALFGDNHAAQALAELFKALDEWIVGGGFLPAAWRNRSTAT